MTLPALVLIAALAQEGAQPEGPIPLETIWDEGLHFRTRDRAYDVHVGGRIFADIGFLSAGRELEEDLGPLENGSEIRSARLQANGRLFDGRATLALGAFRESDDTTVYLEDGGVAVTARATALPWREDDGTRLAHLGVSYTRRNPVDDGVAFAHRPETRLAPDFVDAGTFEADAVDALALEGALLVGPATLQAELFQVRAEGPGTTATYLRGGYALLAFLLTGERRPYRAGRGAFGKILPRKGFFEGGPGAWEIAVRESWLDLDDPPVRGETMHNVTLGLKWHLNAHLQISMNAIHSEREEGGRAEMLLLRFALVF